MTRRFQRRRQLTHELAPVVGQEGQVALDWPELRHAAGEEQGLGNEFVRRGVDQFHQGVAVVGLHGVQSVGVGAKKGPPRPKAKRPPGC